MPDQKLGSSAPKFLILNVPLHHFSHFPWEQTEPLLKSKAGYLLSDKVRVQHRFCPTQSHYAHSNSANLLVRRTVWWDEILDSGTQFSLGFPKRNKKSYAHLPLDPRVLLSSHPLEEGPEESSLCRMGFLELFPSPENTPLHQLECILHMQPELDFRTLWAPPRYQLSILHLAGLHPSGS